MFVGWQWVNGWRGSGLGGREAVWRSGAGLESGRKCYLNGICAELTPPEAYQLKTIFPKLNIEAYSKNRERLINYYGSIPYDFCKNSIYFNYKEVKTEFKKVYQGGLRLKDGKISMDEARAIYIGECILGTEEPYGKGLNIFSNGNFSQGYFSKQDHKHNNIAFTFGYSEM